ncbi:hypothetical protein IFM89_015860 [Coptis chinensis]|uniref:Uncharacterized protein n=1 Tax=Coptis chinensis TaxID=261450 RepID=A0A835M634_9MAGN|nr:hypothetical protein IFM89_015860 [Coptis chinensis]
MADQEDVPTHCAIVRGQAQVQRVDQVEVDVRPLRPSNDNNFELTLLLNLIASNLETKVDDAEFEENEVYAMI